MIIAKKIAQARDWTRRLALDCTFIAVYAALLAYLDFKEREGLKK